MKWNLSFGTPPFRGHKIWSMNVDIFIFAFVTFIKETPLRGGHSREVWVEVCRQSLQNLRTLFIKKKIAHFATLLKARDLIL